MGPCCGLSCDCCRLNVGPCNESETVEAVAAAAPASTAAEAARLNLGATEVHPVQDQSNPELPKDLAARPKRWTTKIGRRNKIWPVGNKGSDEDRQVPARGGVENMKSELRKSNAQANLCLAARPKRWTPKLWRRNKIWPVGNKDSDEHLEESAQSDVEENMRSELRKSNAQGNLCLAARPKRWTPKLWRWNKIWPVGNKDSDEHLEESAQSDVEENMRSELRKSNAQGNLCLAARPKRWTPKLWRWNKIWRFGNKGSVEHLQAFPHDGVEDNTGSELDLSTAEYDNRPVEELQEPAHGSVEDMKSELELSTAEYDDLSDEDLQEPAYGGVEDMKSELSTSKTQSQLYLVEDLSEGPSGGLEDLMTSEMAKERRQAYLCWAEMAESRLKKSPSSQVRGLLRLPRPK
uniref:uncharacterized protein C22orf42 n=1 Tax=Macaca mulatta TaxID=9544 RepID=UPI0010A20FAE|nr:uncharacterized protein C22orf42 [Macaca mulatta]